MKVTEPKLKKAYDECLVMLNSLGIKPGNVVELKVNTRAKRRWGLCSYTVYSNRWSACSYKIEISDLLLESYQGLLNTMMHELLHTCKGGHTHKGQWKVLANKVNEAYHLNIKRTSSPEEKGLKSYSYKKVRNESSKYRVSCYSCGHDFYYKRAGGVVQCIMENEYDHGCTCTCGSHKLWLYDMRTGQCWG